MDPIFNENYSKELNNIIRQSGNYSYYSIQIHHLRAGRYSWRFLSWFVTFYMYATSVLTFFVNLGILMHSGLLSALIADYLMTPILLNLTQIMQLK